MIFLQRASKLTASSRATAPPSFTVRRERVWRVPAASSLSPYTKNLISGDRDPGDGYLQRVSARATGASTTIE